MRLSCQSLTVLLSSLLLTIGSALGAEGADLPPASQVAQALATHPAVRAATATIAVEQAQRDRLEAGPHEFALILGSTRRRELPTEQRFHEKELGLQRAFRLPGKSGTDARLGAAGVAHAQHMLGEALHETARLLLNLWFNALRESTALGEWEAQLTLLREQARAASRRAALGDSSALDQSQAEAQLAQGEAQQIQARTRLALAREELTQHFPGISLPPNPSLATPQALQQSPDDWREQILHHHHELAVARSASQRQRIAAERADRERLPDPTLGLRWSSERDGQEKLFGVQLIIPLPGSARTAISRSAEAEAEIANTREAQILAKAQSDARRAVMLAEASYAQWQRLDLVAAKMEANARLLDRAWRLGEGQLAELITARRLAIEAHLAAIQARGDASENRYRLLLDAHQLWALDQDHESANEH